MASEAQWVEDIARLADASGAGSVDCLLLLEQALVEHPQSAVLWNRRGDLIQLLDAAFAQYSLDEARASYARAIAVAPNDPEGYESLGHYFDAVSADPGQAEAMFREAVDRGGGPAAWAGLARLIAQRGRHDEAVHLLSPPTCPCASAQEVVDALADVSAKR